MWNRRNRLGQSSCRPEIATACGDARRARASRSGRCGLFVDGQAALGHRRLSIVDLATGKQPLANEDETIWISFNGEIYNHRDLRRELEGLRPRLSHALGYREHRARLRAMGRRLRRPPARHVRVRDLGCPPAPAARSPAIGSGVKPLYWARCGDRCSSRPRSRRILAERPRRRRSRTNPRFRSCSARGRSPAARRCSRAIYKLLPGHVLTFERGEVVCRRYWDVPTGAAPCRRRRRAGTTTSAAFATLLEESIRLRLMSDVPLGVFLSGGIDSSAIAALMAPMIGTAAADVLGRLQGARVQRAAIRAAGRAGDWRGRRTRSSSTSATSSARCRGSSGTRTSRSRIPSSVPLTSSPSSRGSSVTVVLTGEGSDELLAGYGKYPRSLLNWRAGSLYAKTVPHAVRQPSGGVGRARARASRALCPALLRRRRARARSHVLRHVRRRRSGAAAAPVVTRACALLADQERAYGSSMAHFNAPNERTSLLDRVLYADMKTYLVELLMKQDQMSMAASIESRVPFLDHQLVEFAAGLPADRKLSGLSTKRILREAVQDVLPRQILERPKMGFPVPFGPWLQNGWGPRRPRRPARSPRAPARHLRTGRGRTPADDRRRPVEQPGRRRGVGAPEPRALVPDVHRWRRRPDTASAGRDSGERRRCDGVRTPAVGVAPCASSGSAQTCSSRSTRAASCAPGT